MRLVVTVDTEEDNWIPFNGAPHTSNAVEIPRLQALFERYGARPTYLVTYDMARDDRLVGFLSEAQAQGRCEVGAHCHPWNTPPLLERPTEYNSMLGNLPDSLVEAKLNSLHALLSSGFGRSPTSFRSGRWGFGPHVATILSRLGYLFESSVTAITDWSFCHGPDYSLMPPALYRFNPPQIYTPAAEGAMVQLPASVGYLRRDFLRWARLEQRIRTGPLRRLRLLGLLDRLTIVQRAALNPEYSDGDRMCRLADAMAREGHRYLNVFFHSPTLKPGLTPFVRTSADRNDFLGRIESLLAHLARRGVTSMTATEVAWRELAPAESGGDSVTNRCSKPSPLSHGIPG